MAVFHCITIHHYNGIHRDERVVTLLTHTKQNYYSTKYSIPYILS